MLLEGYRLIDEINRAWEDRGAYPRAAKAVKSRS